MHDVMTQNFRLISDLQKQLEKHMSNCSWRVVAKFGADAVEFRLFWVALKKKKRYWSYASVQSLACIQGCKGQRGAWDHVNKQPTYSRLDITHIEGAGKLPLVSLSLCWTLSTHLGLMPSVPLDTVLKTTFDLATEMLMLPGSWWVWYKQIFGQSKGTVATNTSYCLQNSKPPNSCKTIIFWCIYIENDCKGNVCHYSSARVTEEYKVINKSRVNGSSILY